MSARDKQFRGLAELNPGAVIVQVDGKIEFANKSACLMFRAKNTGGLLGKDSLSIVAPEFRDTIRQRCAMAETKALTEPFVETRHQRLDGATFESEMIAAPIEWKGRSGTVSIISDLTDQKKSEAALRNSEARFRDLAEGSIQGILVMDTGARPLFANNSAAYVFGYADEKDLMKLESFTELVAHDERERLAGNRKSLLARMSAPGFHEVEGRRKDGSAVWFQYFSQVMDWRGSLAILVTLIDITERNKFEAELLESEKLFRGLTDGSLQGVVVHQNFRALYANQTFADIFGYDSPEKIIALESVMPLVAPHDRDRISGYQKSHLAGNFPPVRFEFQGLRKDGSTIWLEAEVGMVTWGGAPATQAICVDITKRKKAEQAMRRSEQNLSTIIHTSPHIMAITGAEDGVYYDVNDTWLSVTGYAREEVIGHNSKELNFWVYPEHREQILATVKAQGYVHNYETAYADKDGCVTPVICSVEWIEMNGEQRLLSVSTDITEQKQAQDALRDSEARFRDLAEGSIQGILVTDKDSRLLFANQSAAAIFGYDSPDDLMKLNSLDEIAVPHDRERIKGFRKARFAGKPAPSVYDIEGVRKDGSTVWFETFVRNIEWKGTPATQTTIIDITDRKQIEAELRMREGQFSAFFANAPAGMALVDKDLRFLRINEPLARLNGLSVEDHIGKTLQEVLDPTLANIDEIVEKYRDMLKGDGARATLDITVINPDDPQRKIHNLVTRFAIPGPDGRPDSLGAIVTDITERRQVEEEVRATAEKLDAILKASPLAVFTIDMKGHVLNWNPASETTFGWREDEVLGKFNPLISENDRGIFLKSVANSARGKNLLGTEFCHLHKNGTPIDVAIWTAPLRDAAGNIVGVMGILEDITDKKRAEAALRERDEKLAVLQAKFLQVSRDSTMGQLSSALAHEFAQPLAAITNYIQVARDMTATGRSNQKIVNIMDKAIEQAERAAAVIASLRAFFRKGKQARRQECLNELLEEAVSLTLIGKEDSQLEVCLEFSRSLPKVEVDKIQIQQVALNLMRNAVEAMQCSDRRELVLRTRLVGTMVQVDVCDTGPGLSDDVRAEMFEPFVTSRSAGMGMGLSISKSIIEAHGGKLSARSVKGRGTTFSFELPVSLPQSGRQ